MEAGHPCPKPGCDGIIRVRSSRRCGEHSIARLECPVCRTVGCSIRDAAKVRRRKARKLHTISAETSSAPRGAEVIIDVAQQEFETMAKRQIVLTERGTVLADLAAFHADDPIPALKAELHKVREAIENHELEQLKRRAVELAQAIESADRIRVKRHMDLEDRLSALEPPMLTALRVQVNDLHKRHMNTSPPVVLRDRFGNVEDRSEFDRWHARGKALVECVCELRDGWKIPNPVPFINDVVARYGKEIAELRFIVAKETENVHV